MTLSDIRKKNQLGHSLIAPYGISKFSLEGGGKMAKISMRNNSEPHLPLIFLMWTKNFCHWKIIIASEMPSPFPALSSLST